MKLPKTSFPAEVDDGATKLASARWQRLSVKELKYWYEQAPIKRSHKYVNIPLKHVGGTNCVSEKVIALLHDQTVPLTMKQFLQDNCAVASKPKITFTGPGGSSTCDYAWVEATTMAHAHEAILNYQVCLHHLFPWVTTGFIIQRVLLKVNWLADYGHLATRLGIIRTFFNSVLRINAGRACKRGIPMNFKEQFEQMTSIMERTPKQSGGQALAQAGGQQDGYRIPRAAPPRATAGPRTSAAGTKKDNRPRFNGLLLCFDFNNTKGLECSRPPTALGCREPKGQEYAHRCNQKAVGGAYCLMAHKRKEH